ncbi:MerR family transcriptional regulator [Cloacibacillus sp. An23]|uniref:MerR family transcriptional regulator n=1 Tax=Cloacibacillus sp. An23 TaxID=1965591 RepID=UPI000B39BDFA|nr:MerR family transcriptional regulator [Cloacibacillus sp. An23]OUO94391.1 hypothetical protein B5F39_03965 [Cloacibacillus sp. An23]
MYTIKQVSELTGISGYTLRYYDKEGLFPDLGRDDGNRRVFSDEDLKSVRTIQTLREMGLPIARIRAFVEAGRGGRALERRGAIIAEQMERAKSELEDMKKKITMLSRAAAYYKEELSKSGARGASTMAA